MIECVIEQYINRLYNKQENPWDLRIEISSYLLDLEYRAHIARGSMTVKEAEQSKRMNMRRVIDYYDSMRLIPERSLIMRP